MSGDPPTTEEALQEGGRQERREILQDTTEQALEEGNLDFLRLALNSQHAADLAELFRHLKEEEQQQILPLLAEPLAAETLAEMDTATLLDVTDDLDDAQLSDLVVEMDPDDAADLLSDLPDEQSEKVLDLMPEGAAEVRQLLEHPEDSGGGIMTSRLLAVRQDMSVADAVEQIRQQADEDDYFYIYVVDGRRHLQGTVPIRRILLAEPQALMGDLADPNPISVSAAMDQEEIAHIFSDYNLLAVPVVDEDGRLMGQVTVDDIVDVIEDEATEDIYTLAATSSEELEERSVLGVARRRLPWLLVCLAGTLLSGGVIDVFDDILAGTGVLLLFVPAIMAMGGNAGIQTSTVTVRSLATGQLAGGAVLATIGRELRIALSMAALLGVLVFAVAQLWTGSRPIGLCVGLAMFAAIVLSAGLGALIPLLFRSLKVDPAVASGPLITTLNDSISLVIYFGIAFWLLGTL